jgi:chromosome segregation ATPase
MNHDSIFAVHKKSTHLAKGRRSDRRSTELELGDSGAGTEERQDFYGDSLGSLKGQLQDSRSQLQDLLHQLPNSREDTRAQLEQLVQSYQTIEDSLEEVAQEQGVQEAVNQVAQQEEGAQQIAGQAAEQKAEQAQNGEIPVAKSSRRDQVRGAATGAAGKALEIAGPLPVTSAPRSKAFWPGTKAPWTRRRAIRRSC